MTGRKILAALAALALLLSGPAPGAAFTPVIREAFPAGWQGSGMALGPPPKPGRVVMVVTDYLQIRDLGGRLPPNLARLAAGGAVALINANTGGAITPENTYATIGSGSHIIARRSAQAGLAAGERLAGGTAADEYRRRTGLAPPAGSLVCLEIARIYMQNEKFRYDTVPGALGREVRGAGFKTAALGNSDGPNGPGRQIVTMVMDHRGIVDTGSVGGGVVRPQKDFPGGAGSDYGAILREFDRLPPDVRLVAIDLGDLGRLQAARAYVQRDRWQSLREEAILGIDGFLGGLLGRLDPAGDLLALVCPTPGDDGEKKDRLSPVILYGGGLPGGLLVSPTTRRAGIIMNIDLAPTVLHFMSIKPEFFFTGRPAQVIPGSFGLEAVAGMHRALDLIYGVRPYLQKGYILYQLLLLAFSLGLIFLKKKGKEVLKPFFLAVMAVPLAYLLMPLLPAAGIAAMSAELITVTVALTGITILLHRRFGADPFLVICLATAAAISADLAAGSPLQKASVFGYDPIVGARFYGLGNEYMGVLIGSTLIGVTSLIAAMERRRRLATAASGAACLAVLGLIAAPRFGTNLGGTIAAATAFLALFLMLREVRLTWPRVLAAGAGVALAVLALALYDTGRPAGQQTHIGRTATLVMTGGLNELAGIIGRKSEMNIKLVRYTIWSRVLLASLGALALLFYRPVGVMEGIRSRHPDLFRGLVAVVAGSLAAFIFNDSGVVAAATVMIFGAPPLLYLVLDQLEN